MHCSIVVHNITLQHPPPTSSPPSASTRGMRAAIGRVFFENLRKRQKGVLKFFLLFALSFFSSILPTQPHSACEHRFILVQFILLLYTDYRSSSLSPRLSPISTRPLNPSLLSLIEFNQYSRSPPLLLPRPVSTHHRHPTIHFNPALLLWKGPPVSLSSASSLVVPLLLEESRRNCEENAWAEHGIEAKDQQVWEAVLAIACIHWFTIMCHVYSTCSQLSPVPT